MVFFKTPKHMKRKRNALIKLIFISVVIKHKRNINYIVLVQSEKRLVTDYSWGEKYEKCTVINHKIFNADYIEFKSISVENCAEMYCN